MRQETDEALAGLYRRSPDSTEGQAAARELFERYRERVYLWCARRVRNREEALDLAQDVLVSAFRALASFEGRARYSTWIFTIARNRCHRAMRAPSLVRDDEVEVDSTAAPGPDPLERLAREQDEARLLSLMLETLEPRESRALWLRCVERLTVAEVTRALDIAGSSGARSVLQNARKKLRAVLERRIAEES